VLAPQALMTAADVKIVQRQLGHESATMTLDTYAKLFPDDLDAQAARLVPPSTADSARTARTLTPLKAIGNGR
jgi:hypothetical protein